jgi:hypothetical protein
MRIRPIVVLAFTLGFIRVETASAQNGNIPSPDLFARITFVPTAAVPIAAPPIPLRLTFTDADLAQATQPATTPRTKAFVYSDAYHTRAKIHRYASFATLPLFAAEGFVGQSLYTNPTQGKKSAHLAIATGIGTLFGVNAVTGVWNMIDARKDPNGHTKRTIHGILMLAASGGFFATAATGPHSDLGEPGRDGGGGGDGGGGNRSLHRGIAFTSIGLATASYLIMLFGK